MYLFWRWFTNQPKTRYSNSLDQLSASQNQTGVCTQVTAFVILSLGYLGIGYSRFLLGAHASNQIFYGFLLGGWSLMMCIYFIGPRVQRLVDMLKRKQLTPDDQKSALTVGYALSFFMVLA